jgi:spermidine synthase
MFLNEKNIYKISAISIGFTSVITQIILIREFLSVYSSNELVIGILFSNWMLLTGLGAYIGKLNSPNKTISIVILQVLMGVLPLVTVFSLSFFRNIIFTPGRMLSPFEIYYSSLIILTPFCIVSGFLFTWLSKKVSELLKKNLISEIYSFEAIGSIAGGLLFNFLFLFLFSTFDSLKIIFVINFILAVLFLLVLNKKTAAAITALSGLIIIVLIIPENIDKKALSYLYPNQEIIDYKETPFGKLTVTKVADQLNFYKNGTTLFSTNNVMANEENIHYAMVQHSKPENILLVSGGISGTIKEVLKYSINSLDYVEINPWIIEEGEKFTDNIAKNKKVRIINKDARLFLKNSDKKYDVAIINLPAPSNIEINRYYTYEFFEEMERRLTKNGVLSINLPPTANYTGDESAEIHSVIYSTLEEVFRNILIIQGGRNYFLASNGQLSYRISNLIESKQINTEYVNKYYIDDNQIKERGNQIIKELNPKTEINRDFKPVASFLQWRYWLAHFNISGNIWIFIITIPVFVIVSRMNIINIGLFTTGLTTVSTEIILLISFQILYGYIYQMTGIIITIFMIGLAYGSFRFYKILGTNFKTFYYVQFATGVFTLLLPVAIFSLDSLSANGIIVHIILFILVFVSGILTGTQFSIATKLSDGTLSAIAAGSYSSEIIGSAFGALLISAVLIPVIGIFSTCILIGALNMIIASIIFSKSKLY